MVCLPPPSFQLPRRNKPRSSDAHHSPCSLPHHPAYFQEFQGGGNRGGGVLYPSPASRFGARDSDSLRLTTVPFGPIADDGGVAMDVSPHFASRREGRSLDRRSPEGDRWNTSHSPFFDKFDGKGRYSSGRESPTSRQPGREGIGAVSSYRRGGARLRSSLEPPVAAASVWCPSASELGERAWEGKSGDEPENRARGQQMQDVHGYRSGVREGWAANVSDVRSQTTPPPQTAAEFGAIDNPQNSRREAYSKQQHAGRRLRGSDSDSPDPLVVSRNSQKGRWLGHLPAVAEETRSSKRCKDNIYTVEGGNARSLSRLFDYAFTDKGKGRRQGLDVTVGGSEISRNDGGHLDGGDGGRSPRATFPTGVEDAARTSQDARRPQSSPSPAPPSTGARGALAAGKEKQTLVGVMVRRPQSPQFGFMAESDQSDGFMAENNQTNGFMAENDQSNARQRCPSWQQDSLNTRRNDEEGSKCVTGGQSKVIDAGQQAVRSSNHADKTGRYNEGSAIPNTRMVVAETATSRSVDHSPLVGWEGDIPCLAAGTACTPPRASKRRRPESWATTTDALAGTPPPFPLASGRSANLGHSNQEEALQPPSRPLEKTRSSGADNGLGLEGGGTYADGDTAGAARLPGTGDGAWVQGRGGLREASGENGVMEPEDGAGETMTLPPPPSPPPPEYELSAAGDRAITEPLEAGMFAETPRVDSAREGGGSGRVEEDSQRAAGVHLEAEDIADTPRLDLAHAGDATAWVGEGSQRLAGLDRLDQQHEGFVGSIETTPDVGATPGPPPPRPEAGSGNNRYGPRDTLLDDSSNAKDYPDDSSNAKDYPGSTASARAADAVLAYDRDVLGGDGLADRRCVRKVGWFEWELGNGSIGSIISADSRGRSGKTLSCSFFCDGSFGSSLGRVLVWY